MSGIQDAQTRWQRVRAKGRTSGLIIAVVAVVMAVAVIVLAKDSAAFVLGGLVILVIGVAVIAMIVGRRRTGLTINPEWKPIQLNEFDDDELDGEDAPLHSSTDTDVEVPTIRQLDAQILGVDLTRLGQLVSPKLSKSYAMGDLVLKNEKIRWVPSIASAEQGIEPLVTEPAQVSSVERAVLWGSWALVRVACIDGSEWCMRVPNSVDLTPAFQELGLTLQVVDA